MKRILMAAAALGLLIGTPALAQDNQDKHDRGGQAKAEKPAKPDKAPNRGPSHANPNPGGGMGNPGPRPNPGGAHDRNPGPMGGRDNRNPNWNRPGNPNVHPNRGPQPQPRNFDRRAYQRNVQASRRFRLGVYRQPPGFYYRRWGYGQMLPFAFFARDYWLNDYYAYDLPVPPYGYQWVRYGSDAILVDVRTGQILQVEYGVFY